MCLWESLPCKFSFSYNVFISFYFWSHSGFIKCGRKYFLFSCSLKNVCKTDIFFSSLSVWKAIWPSGPEHFCQKDFNYRTKFRISISFCVSSIKIKFLEEIFSFHLNCQDYQYKVIHKVFLVFLMSLKSLLMSLFLILVICVFSLIFLHHSCWFLTVHCRRMSHKQLSCKREGAGENSRKDCCPKQLLSPVFISYRQ